MKTKEPRTPPLRPNPSGAVADVVVSDDGSDGEIVCLEQDQDCALFARNGNDHDDDDSVDGTISKQISSQRTPSPRRASRRRTSLAIPVSKDNSTGNKLGGSMRVTKTVNSSGTERPCRYSGTSEPTTPSVPVARGGVACPFPWKLHEMLEYVSETPGLESVVSWDELGTSFAVHKPVVFVGTILPM